MHLAKIYYCDVVDHAREALADRGHVHSNYGDISRKLGVACVKYADLSASRDKNYRFSPKKMTSFSGNTALYMLYVTSRIRFNLYMSCFYSK